LKTWKLTVEYDGTKYSGWQEQLNARTVQGQLRKAAEEFLGEVDIQGSGRTDAGVHAIAQVAHLRGRGKRSYPPPREILRALNDRLPSDICILDVAEETDKFHARHDALARTYLYQISTRRSAFLKKYIWWVKDPLDIALMSRAARMLAGRHNFVCFRAFDDTRPDESTVVVVDDASIEEEGHMILFRITGSHFLWRMVRRIVGVLVKIGKGEITLEQFGRLLEGQAGDGMDIAAWTAPASGLFLEKIDYPAGPARRKRP